MKVNPNKFAIPADKKTVKETVNMDFGYGDEDMPDNDEENKDDGDDFM
jgi:hypothetical protein